MIVGICKTKRGENAEIWLNSFRRGVVESGDSVVDVTNIRDCHKLKDCDVSFQVCESDFSRSADAYFRRSIGHYCSNRIILDVGIIATNKLGPVGERRAGIYLNSVKRWGVYYDNMPPDRWLALNKKKPEWRKDGDHILVLGQTPHGIGVANVPNRDIMAWSKQVLQTLSRLTNRPIIYKAHPTQTKMPPPVKNCHIIGAGFGYNLMSLLEGAWCTVASASNGGCDSIMAGIPVITENSMSLAYDVAGHSLEDIENPPTPDVSQWLNNIAYAQWTNNEMISGETWNFIKKKLEKKDGT